jgi:hypothetical protein
MEVVSFASQPLYSRRKRPRYQLDWKPSGPQIRNGHCWVNNHLVSARNRTPAVQPVARRYTIPAPNKFHAETEREMTSVKALKLYSCSRSDGPEISAETWTQTLGANTRIIPRLGHNRFLPNPFQFIHHRPIRLYTVYVRSVVG